MMSSARNIRAREWLVHKLGGHLPPPVEQADELAGGDEASVVEVSGAEDNVEVSSLRVTQSVEAKRTDVAVRKRLAYGFFGLLVLTCLAEIAAAFVGGPAWDHMNTFLVPWLPTLVGLLMASVAFYYNDH